MNYCALVCEYNPLHNGHLYQMRRIKEITGCNRIICIMSGDFVQRAEPAIINKVSRAKCALECGADMVVELPVVYAVGNGAVFAQGAVKAIDMLPDVTHIAMGCETDNVELIEKLAEIQAQESDGFKNILYDLLEKGLSYPSGYTEATAQIAEKSGLDGIMSRMVLSKPNNILCIEYIKALKKLKSSIKPVLIPRKASGIYCEENTEIVSSSEIRSRLSSGALPDIKLSVPPMTLKALETRRFPDKKTYSDIVMYVLRNASIRQLSHLCEVGEGLEYSIAKQANATCDLDEFLVRLKSKRYTLSRLKRICLQAVLNIDKSLMSGITLPYYRILAIKTDFKDYLASLSENFYVQISKAQDKSREIFCELEKKSTLLYSLIVHDPDYKYPSALVTL